MTMLNQFKRALTPPAFENEELARVARFLNLVFLSTLALTALLILAVLPTVLGGSGLLSRLTVVGPLSLPTLGALVLFRLGYVRLLEHAHRNEQTQIQTNRELRDTRAFLEARIALRTRDLDLAAEVGRRVSQVRDLDALLAEAVELIRARFDLYYTQIYLTDPAERILALRSGTGAVGAELVKRGHRLLLGPGSINGAAAVDRRAVIVSDTTDSRIFQPNPLLPETRSEIAVPLIAGDRLLGVLDLQSAQVDGLTADQLVVFQALAGQLAVAIENANLFAEAEQARAEVEAQARRLTGVGWKDFLDGVERSERVGYTYDLNNLTPLTETLTKSNEPSALEAPVQVAGEPIGLFEIEAEADRVWTEDEIAVVNSVARQVGQQTENLRLFAEAERYRREAEEAARRLAREGWEDYLEKIAVAERGYVYDQNQVAPLQAELTSDGAETLIKSLTVQGEPIGELVVAEVESLSDQAHELLDAVAGQLSAHLENLRLLEETERGRQLLNRRAVELETVAKVSTATSTILEAQKLLEAVVDLTKVSFGLYHAHIYVLSEAGDALVLRAGAGEVGQRMVAEEWKIPIIWERSLVARAARTRRAVIVNDVSTAPDFLPNALLPETRSEMAIPLIVSDTLLGVFDVQSNQINHFSEEEARIQTTLAAQVAVALQNANLYAEQTATVTRLRELDHLKSSFLANMSHELRTPLNSILGFAEVMREGLDGPLTERMETDLGIIYSNGQHLLNLINDILDMAKIEAGKMSLSPERFNMQELLEEVMAITTPLARDKDLSLALDADPTAPLYLEADRIRMRQVMINLVNNAIKFTEAGRITLRAVETDGHIRISVHDSGIGIPTDELESIFQEFHQVDASTTRKVGGTGLGLPISRHLVMMHGGRLWAESSGLPGEGSTFFIEMPLESQVGYEDL